ncbi:MAG: hypothetical protein ABJL18_00300 [Hyphomicrobiales bacterium]
MQFFLQATLLTHVFNIENTQSDAHDDVFREFSKTLMSLVATPEVTARIRMLPSL